MSCLALPVFGRPTRRARRNSASVDSGMSEYNLCGYWAYAWRPLRLALHALMMQIVSVSFFNLRNAYTIKRTRPPRENPRRFHRCSAATCSRSSQSRASESPKTVAASSTGLHASQVLQGLARVPGEHIYAYTLINIDRPPARLNSLSHLTEPRSEHHRCAGRA
jgi:hypothetical protein